MKKRISIPLLLLEIALAGGLIVTGFLLYTNFKQDADTSKELQQIAIEYTGKADPAPVETPEVIPEEVELEEEKLPAINADFDALRALNPEIVGWVRVPNTHIDYPVLQGKDNQKYLRTDYEGKYSYNGSIFMDWRVKLPDTKAYIAYGHNMGSTKTIMFSDLTAYRDQEFYQENPSFSFALDDGTMNGIENEWEIFAVCVTDSHKDANIKAFYATDWETEEDYEAYIENLYSHSLYETAHTDIPEKFVALGTCSQASANRAERLIVYAGLFVAE